MTTTKGIPLWKRAYVLLEEFIRLRWVRAIWMYLVRIVERMESNHIFLSAAGLS